MALYVLKAIYPVRPMLEPAFAGFVVRANSEKQARILVAEYVDAEGESNMWFDAEETECRMLPAAGVTEIILSDKREP